MMKPPGVRNVVATLEKGRCWQEQDSNSAFCYYKGKYLTVKSGLIYRGPIFVELVQIDG